MTDLNKNQPQRTRFGSDWELDLGWVLIWLIVGLTIAAVVSSIAWAIVSTNDRNNQKEEQYIKNCKQVDVTYIVGNSKKTYECK